MSPTVWCFKARFLLIGFILLATLLSMEVRADSLRMGDVAKELICQCGCNNVLSVCEMQGWAVPAKELIQTKIDAGLSKEEIVGYFVEQYGPKILAAPPKKGFNLTVWVIPFVIIGAGAMLIVFLLKIWVRRQSARGEDGESLLEEMTEEEMSRYKKEIESELNSWNL